MKGFDAFSKPVGDFTVKTALGGYLALCSFLVMLALFVNELIFFMQVERVDKVMLDQTFAAATVPHLDITFEIELPNFPCGALAVNVLDKEKKGAHSHSTDKIYKIRSNGLGMVRTGLEMLSGEEAEGCMPCYDTEQCCETCAEVHESWRARGLKEPSDYFFEQCVDALYKAQPVARGEGCTVKADLNLRAVNARIELGFLPEEKIVAHPSWNLTDADFSHSIADLAFGPEYPGVVHVLRGRTKKGHRPGMQDHYHYDLHLIPTQYTDIRGKTIATHQYSSTEFTKSFEYRTSTSPPGVYFVYDITPFIAVVTETKKSFGDFLTQCCALVGGVFAFSRMVDAFGYALARSVAKRLVRNKAKCGEVLGCN